MKRVLSAAAALSVFAFAQQAQATDFILSNNAANPAWLNFRLTFQNATSSSAALGNNPGTGPFTDNYFFAPGLPNSIGSGSATANILSGLLFSLPPNGLSISGYFLTGPVVAALTSAFTDGAGGYAPELAIVSAAAAGLPDYFQAGTGDANTANLTTVPLSGAMFYKITFSGAGDNVGSRYDGNLSSTSVPEPTTWALMLAGFGAVGFAMRSRRKAHPKVRFAF